jgi:hypothetical protein
MLRDGDELFDELLALEDAEELCRRLLATPWAWGFGRSTRYQEAVELLAGVSGTSELAPAFVAFMVCTCRRWDRVTARLIGAVEQSGLLDDRDLDDLADSLLSHEHVISYPLAWVAPDEIAIADETGHVHTVSDDTLEHHRPNVEPPLRRWAARRVLAADPSRIGQLLDAAKQFEPRHRDAVIHGLLDAAAALDQRHQRTLLTRGLAGGQSGVRLAALALLCELDGPDAARRRARDDPNATVRKWTGPTEPIQTALL